MEYFVNISKSRYILTSLVRQDLKNRYRRSYLGFAWSLITPLALVSVIGVVFSIVLGQPIREFIPFLFSGLIPWFFLVYSADGGAAAFIVAEGYIKQTQTPLEIFPLRVALVAFVNLVFSITAFFIIFFIIDSNKFNFNMLMSIPALFLWLIMGCSISTIAAVINTYLRDYAHIQSIMLQALFYATPILYPPEIVGREGFKWIYLWNPIYYMIEIIRRPLLGDALPEPRVWILSILFVLTSAVIAIFLISKIGRKLVYEL